MITERYMRQNPLASCVLFKTERVAGRITCLCAGTHSAIAMSNNAAGDLCTFPPFCAYFHKLITQAWKLVQAEPWWGKPGKGCGKQFVVVAVVT